MTTKIGMSDYVLNIYPCAELHYDRLGDFASVDFDAEYVERRFVQGCAFWGPKHFDPIFYKKRKYSADFRLDLKKFKLKTTLT